MPGIDPGEFGRAGAAREDARLERERAVLDQLLGAGWSADTAMEAHRLHTAVGDVVHGFMQGGMPMPYNETALSLVGEARGAALADWWAESRGLDDTTRTLLRECAMAAAAMAMVDGYLLGACPETPAPAVRPARPPRHIDTRVPVYARR